jgi:hypothetical protein
MPDSTPKEAKITPTDETDPILAFRGSGKNL